MLPVVLLLGQLLGCDAGHECGELRACDVRDTRCQQVVVELAACLAGGEASAVEVQVRAFPEYADEELGDAEALDEAVMESTRRWYRGLSLLGLASGELSPVDTTRTYLSWIGAFYDREDGRITILDRGAPLESLGMRLTLVHEVVHAIQDQQADIGRLWEQHGQGVDGSLALGAVTEGEATLHTDRALMLALGAEESTVDFEGAYATYAAIGFAAARRDDERWVNLQRRFTYPVGSRYVHAAFAAGGTDAIHALYGDLPGSTREVILGVGAEEPNGLPWIDESIGEVAVPLVDGAEVVGHAHAGAFAAITSVAGSSAAVREGLLADRLAVLAEGDELLVFWRLRFASEEGAADYLALASEEFGEEALDVELWLEGAADVVMAAGSEVGRAAALAEAGLVWGPAPEPEDTDAAAAEGAAWAGPARRAFCQGLASPPDVLKQSP